MLIHDACDVADQAQPVVVVTPVEPEPPPTATLCDVGETLCEQPGAVTKRKPFVNVELGPAGLVTVTFTLPAACAGAVVVIAFGETMTFVPAVPPNDTVAPLTKFAPEIVAGVRRRSIPETGSAT